MGKPLALACVIALATCLALPGCGGRRAHAPPPPAPFAPPPFTPPPAPPAPPSEAPPLAQLPQDVRPTRYALALTISPESDRFSGSVEIAVELARPRDLIWLHGKDLAVRQVLVTPEGGAPVAARYEQAHPSGVAALRLSQPVGPGRAKIRLEYDAAFGARLEGLYKVKAAGRAYAFTQFESIFARQAFPCFDEPVFKTPFDVTLFVPTGDEAIANTHETGRADAGRGLTRVTFATTEPLPTYLVAVATGPLDVVAGPPVPPNAVRARPVPLRGVAAKGRGPELAYALAHTGEILSSLEGYFGIAYPYDKLDVLAVPDKGGAMENAGAVTFREWLLLVDEKTAPVDQKRAFAGVMAHELAHQWFGDLVTMPWWNDIWLNEAFATWMGYRTVKTWRPEYQSDVALLDAVEGAMGADSLVSARQIRQEVRSVDDIVNAFDSITYQKGGGVLAMFERWIGPEKFQKGIQAYLGQHRFGSATADHLLAALSATAGRDVATPFRTFLDQPGLPFVEAKVACDGDKPRLEMTQSRFLPLGSTGNADASWQVPVCVRYGIGPEVKETCTLLATKQGSLALEGKGCPLWVHPNADGAGYYRWTLPAADLDKLVRAAPSHLTVRERKSLVTSLRASFSRGTTPAADVMATVTPLASDVHPAVLTAPMDFIRTAHEWLADDPVAEKIRAQGKKLYAQRWRELGWEPKKGEDSMRQVLREQVLTFMTLTVRDPELRLEAHKRGRAYVGDKDGAPLTVHPEAVDPNLAGLALRVAVEEGDAALFDRLLTLLDKTQDEVVRGRILAALGATTRPELAARARELTFDPRLKVVEMMAPLSVQMSTRATREAAWQFFRDRIDTVVTRVSPARAGWLPWMAASSCERTRADELALLFTPRIARIEGGPRNLSGAVEAIRLCAARRDAQLASMRAYYGGAPAKTDGGRAPAAKGAAPKADGPAKGGGDGSGKGGGRGSGGGKGAGGGKTGGTPKN